MRGEGWIRTEEFDSAASVRLFAIGTGGRTLSHFNLGVKRTQDWTEHHAIVFHVLLSTKWYYD